MKMKDFNFLEEALVPRDENGHKVPMVFPGGTGLDGKPLWFPVLPLPKDGKKVPIAFNEDFAPGGQFYGLLSRHFGFLVDRFEGNVQGARVESSTCLHGIRGLRHGGSACKTECQDGE